MRLTMQHKHLFAILTTNKHFTPGDVLERDFDNDAYERRLTAESLDGRRRSFATTD